MHRALHGSIEVGFRVNQAIDLFMAHLDLSNWCWLHVYGVINCHNLGVLTIWSIEIVSNLVAWTNHGKAAIFDGDSLNLAKIWLWSHHIWQKSHHICEERHYFGQWWSWSQYWSWISEEETLHWFKIVEFAWDRPTIDRPSDRIEQPG